MTESDDLSLFEARLLYPFEDEPAPIRLIRQFQSDSSFDRDLASRLLLDLFLYERLTIPTVDMLIVPVLATYLGPGRLTDYLRRGVISFTRYRGAVWYFGNGHGLEMAELRSPWNNPPPGETKAQPPNEAEQLLFDRMVDAASTGIEDSLRLMFEVFSVEEFFGKEATEALARAALDATDEIPDGFFQPALEETYRDVLSSPPARALFIASGGSDLKRLPGINANQGRWLHERLWNDPIDVLLHTAQFNIESLLAERSRARDQTSGPSAHSIVTQKAQALGLHRQTAESFVRLRSIASLPDFGEFAGEEDAVTDRLFELRDSGSAEEFRVWFHANLGRHADDVSRAFVDLLLERDFIDVPLVRHARFVLVSALGFAGDMALAPGSSLLLSAADHAADRFFRRSHPAKVFIDELRDV